MDENERLWDERTCSITVLGSNLNFVQMVEDIRRTSMIFIDFFRKNITTLHFIVY